MHVQRIKAPNGEEMVILSARDYEDLIDARDHARAMQEYRQQPDRWLTDAEMDAYLAAPSPLAFWRKHRRLTQAALAKQAGISQPLLAQMEAGTRRGTVATYGKLAKALSVRMEDLMPR